MRSRVFLFAFLAVAVCFATSIRAAVVPSTPSRFDRLVRPDPSTRLPMVPESPAAAPGYDNERAAWASFQATHGGGWSIHVDRRGGTPTLVAGEGIQWFAPGTTPSLSDLEAKARTFVAEQTILLKVDGSEIRLNAAGSVAGNPYHSSVLFDRVVNGIPVENERIALHLVNGRLVAFGANRWGTVTPRSPVYGSDTAREILLAYLAITPQDRVEEIEPGRLVYVATPPAGLAEGAYRGLPGGGIEFRLAWRFTLRVAGVRGTWVGKVDAVTGELIALYDDAKYSQVRGGVYPLSNDGQGWEGTEQPGWPMPYANVTMGETTATASASGLFECAAGSSATTALTGPYVQLDDICGSATQTGACESGIDFGQGPGTDCVVPEGMGPGDTHAARTSVYHLNRMMEKGRAWLPGNEWLRAPLIDRVNVIDTCNAYWDGSVNFFQSGGGCGNTGEIAEVVIHEWGHGLDMYDGGWYDNPSEAYADVLAFLETHESCQGRGFLLEGNCDGYGDWCLNCTGVRDDDWDQHESHTPATPHLFVRLNCDEGDGPCGREEHCESYLAAETLWDLAARDLPAAGIDGPTAWQIVDRLFYESRPGSGGDAYYCDLATGSSNGCGVGSWFTKLRVADDDDGNLDNGTPHAAAIHAAFARHGIACGAASDPSNQSTSSCPTLATPSLSASAGPRSAALSWTAAPGAASYRILRNELGCERGFRIVGRVDDPETSYFDQGLADGLAVHYSVQALGANPACESSLSTCETGVPRPSAGTIRLDRPTYGCGATIGISVRDGNVGASTVTVAVSSTSESSAELVVLTATSPGSNEYVGSIRGTASPSRPGDGMLQLAEGDTIVALYTDADDGTAGTGASREASARVNDCTPPGAIVDLAVESLSGQSVALTWTAPGDDGAIGAAARYDVRYSTTPIDESNFDSALVAEEAPTPHPAGTIERMEVHGLAGMTTYFFAAKAIDAAGNTGPFGNVASGVTLVPPDIAVSPESFSESLLANQTVTRVLTIRNTGGSDLVFEVGAYPLSAGTVGTSVASRGPDRPLPRVGPAAAGSSGMRLVTVIPPPETGSPSPAPPGAGQDTSAADLTARSPASWTNGAAPRVLVYSDDNTWEPAQGFVDRALQALGLSYTEYYWDPWGFGNALVSGNWDLVVVDHNSESDIGAWWPEIESYLLSGGRALISTHDIDGSETTPTTLWATLGITEGDDVTAASPVYWWAPSHRLFNFPESVPPFASMTDSYYDDGDRVSVAAPARAVGGFSAWSEPGQGAIVVVRAPRAIVNSFLVTENQADLDGDGKPDGVELLENEIDYLLNAAFWVAAEPARGTVPPGATAEVSVTFDATDLNEGDYDANLRISSNDPDQPEIVVPAHLRVTGTPDMTVEPIPVSAESTRSFGFYAPKTRHSLAADLPAGSGGTLRLVAEGNFYGTSQTATAVAEGITLGTVGETLQQCGPASGEYPISAQTLATLVADGVVNVEVTNSPYVSGYCEENTHYVRLVYADSMDPLEFGRLFIGGRRSRTLRIGNRGTGPLEISTIGFDRSDYTSGVEALSVPPGESRELAVTFAPGSVGAVEGTLTLVSNDPDQGTVTVRLRGEGALPPDVDVFPSSFSERLQPDQTLRRVLTIRNTGAGNLVFKIAAQLPTAGVAGSSSLRREPCAARPRAGTSPEASGAVALDRAASPETRWPVPAPVDSIGNGPSATLPSQDALLTEREPRILLYEGDGYRPLGDSYTEQAIRALGLSYEAHYSWDAPGFGDALTSGAWDLVVVDDVHPEGFGYWWPQIESYLLSGGKALITTYDTDGSDADPTTLWSTLGISEVSDSRYAYPVYWWSPSHRLFHHPESVPAFSSLTNRYSDHGDRVDVRGPAHAVAGFTPSSAAGQAAIVIMGSPAAIVNSFLVSENLADRDGDGKWDAAELFENEIDYLLAAAPWLDADPAVGTVPPGGSVDVSVTFDATALDDGDYDASLRVTTNDPDETEVVVPVTMRVTGTPDVAVFPVPIILESEKSYTIPGATTLHALAVDMPPSGGGTLTLVANGDYYYSSDKATVFSEGLTLGSVGGAGTRCIPARGDFPISAERISSLSADGVVNVEVRNSYDVSATCSTNTHRVSLAYADSMDPLEFGPLFPGRARVRKLRIENRGNATLEIASITTDRSEYAPEASSLSVAPRTSRELAVTFTPGFAGVVEGTLVLATNDPDQGTLTIRLHGEGRIPPNIEVSPDSFSESLHTDEVATRVLTIHNTGGSDLVVEVAARVSSPAAISASLVPRGPAHEGATARSTTGRQSPSFLAAVAAPGAEPPVPALPDPGRSAPVTDPVPAPAAPWAPGAAPRILVFADDLNRKPGDHYVDRALLALGLSAESYYGDSVKFWDALVGGTWDLVVIDHNQDYSFGYRWADLESYLLSGGRALITTFDIDGSQGNPTTLWSTLGITPSGDVTAASPVYWWNPSHRLFRVPESVPTFSSMADRYGDEGDRLSVVAPAQAVAGFTPSQSAGEGAIALAGTRRAIVNAFLPSENAADRDADGKADATELIENEIDYLLHAIPWLDVAPARATVPQSESAQVVVTLDATHLDDGDYDASVRVTSNDPDDAERLIPVRLHVTGAPDIAVAAVPIRVESTRPFTRIEATTRHELTVDQATGGGNLMLMAEGDFYDEYKTAAIVAEGISLGSVGRTYRSCSPARGEFPLPAETLASLAADGVVVVTVRNSQYVGPFGCPTNTHQVRLEYAASLEPLDFGPSFLGRTRSRMLRIENRGTAVLEIASIASDRGEFVPEVSSLSLPAHASREVGVTFAPGSTGVFEGTLVLASNDPDSGTLTVRLRGEGLVAPDIDVDPASFSENIRSNETVTRAVTIRNLGGSVLTFEITKDEAPRGLPGQGRVGGPAQPQPIPSAGKPPSEMAPASWQSPPATAVSTPGAAVLLVQEGSPWAHSENQTVLEENGLAFDQIYSEDLAAIDLSAYRLVIVPSAQSTAFYANLVDQASRLEAYVRGGGTLEFHAASEGYYNGDASVVTLPGGVHIRWYSSSSNRVLDPSHPLVRNVPSTFQGSPASLAYFEDLPTGAQLVASDDAGRPNLVVYRLGTGTVVAGAQTLEIARSRSWPGGPILDNMIPFAFESRFGWLASSSVSGTVPPGSEVTIDVTLDGTGLDDGDYDASLRLRTNDPDEAEVVVPVHLHVTGTPDIVVAAAPVTIESTRSYATRGGVTLHALAAELPPTGGGSLELVAEGDFHYYADTATAVAEGISLGTVSARNPTCGPARGEFPVFADTMAALVADGVVKVVVRNSTDVLPYCDTNVHRVRLRYEGSSNPMDYGKVVAGATRVRSVRIENRGSASLEVSSIVSDRGEFVPEVTSLSLPPRGWREVAVTFSPASTEVVEGTLTVGSNDPDEGTVTVRLRGEELVAPDIEVAPSAVTAELPPGGQGTRPLTIGNVGGSELKFRIEKGRIPIPAARTGGADVPAEAATSALADGPGTELSPEGMHARVAQRLAAVGADVLLIQDESPWDSAANEAILEANGLSFDRIGSAELESTDLPVYRLVIVPSDQPTSFYSSLASRAPQIENYVRAGGTLEFHAAGWGSHGGNASLFTLPGGTRIRRYSAYSNDVLDTSHPLVRYVPSSFSESGSASLAYFENLPAGAAIVATDNAGHPDLVVFRFGAGSVVAAGQVLELAHDRASKGGLILENMIPYAYELAPAWLSTSPGSGTVLEGASVTIQADLDARGLEIGSYDSSFRIRSDDPDEPEVVIPVLLRIRPMPDIDLDQTSLDFGSVFVGWPQSLTLAVSNIGTEVLNVREIAVDGLAFSASPSAISVGPGQSREVTVRFDPSSAGVSSATLRIASDDPDEPEVRVDLRGEGVVPPNIELRPAALSEVALRGDRALRTVAIANTGGSQLDFEVILGAGVTAAPDSALIVQDRRPWSTNANESVLTAKGIEYVTFGSAGVSDGALANHPLVIVAGDQYTSTYLNLTSAIGVLERYVAGGGVLEVHASGWGWGGGDASLLRLPGGMGVGQYAAMWNYVVSPDHPLVAGVPNPFPGSPASAGYFRDVPATATVVVTEDYGRPTLLVYPYGAGWVVASCQPIEYSYYYGYSAAPILPNMISFVMSNRPRWITVQPMSGRVAAQTSVDLEVTLHADQLPAGEHLGEVMVRSNDPDEPEVRLSVNLRVVNLIAEAGPDATAECEGDDRAPVSLDGQRSRHADGPASIVAYHWRENDVPVGEGPTLSVPMTVGEHGITLEIQGVEGDTSTDEIRVTVTDTRPPTGGITSPMGGSCHGPAEVPVAVLDDYVDACSSEVLRMYDQPEGASYSTHGDHGVTLTASDPHGNSAPPDYVAFTIDLVPPSVHLESPRDMTWLTGDTFPLSVLFQSHDVDGATGEVLHEVLKIAGCTVLDGATYGDADGLLADDSVIIEVGALCRAMKECGLPRLDQPELRIEASDCGGNVGHAEIHFTGGIALWPGLCTQP